MAYLKVIDDSGATSLGFLVGKSKLAPLKGHTIPRLELCGAVLATELGETICNHMNLSYDICHYYTDSQVVLGYISNTTRRFYTYVANRVEKIHNILKPSQWSYISTDKNPADAGTRFSSSPDMTLVNSWNTGPTWILSQKSNDSDENCYLLVSPNDDKEIRSEIVSLKICISDPKIGCHRFSKFSGWKSLVKAFSVLRHFIQLWRSKHAGKQLCVDKDDPGFRKDTETFIIRQIQCEAFEKEIENLKVQKPIQKDSAILKLDPFIDSEGVLRVGGRLKHSNLSLGEKHPILIPGSHAIAKLLVSYYHELVRHQ